MTVLFLRQKSEVSFALSTMLNYKKTNLALCQQLCSSDRYIPAIMYNNVNAYDAAGAWQTR